MPTCEESLYQVLLVICKNSRNFRRFCEHESIGIDPNDYSAGQNSERAQNVIEALRAMSNEWDVCCHTYIDVARSVISTRKIEGGGTAVADTENKDSQSIFEEMLVILQRLGASPTAKVGPKGKNRKPLVFLSHNKNDSSEVGRILDGCVSADSESQFSFWIDVEELRCGRWHEKITEALQQTNVFVMCLGPSGYGNTQVKEFLSAEEDVRIESIFVLVLPSYSVEASLDQFITKGYSCIDLRGCDRGDEGVKVISCLKGIFQ